MKIGYRSLNLEEGKVKYIDDKLDALTEKHNPKKVSPFYVEFLKGDFEHADVILVGDEDLIDLLIHDTVKCENRLVRCEDESEKQLLKKCLISMEDEIPLCDSNLTELEKEQLFTLQLYSLKPVIVVSKIGELNDLIHRALSSAGIIFFYTAGPKEVRAWPVSKGSDIITCAGKIHSDLARGFIKGDVVRFEDYTKYHNFNDCRSKGVVQVVNRDHIVEDGNVIEIRFNV